MCSCLGMSGVTKISSYVPSKRSTRMFDKDDAMSFTHYDTVTQHGSLKLAHQSDRSWLCVDTSVSKQHSICKGYRCSTHGRNGCYLTRLNHGVIPCFGRNGDAFPMSLIAGMLHADVAELVDALVSGSRCSVLTYTCWIMQPRRSPCVHYGMVKYGCVQRGLLLPTRV